MKRPDLRPMRAIVHLPGTSAYPSVPRADAGMAQPRCPADPRIAAPRAYINSTMRETLPPDDWRAEFERRALMSDCIAVIDGKVIEPHTPEAAAAKAAIAAAEGRTS